MCFMWSFKLTSVIQDSLLLLLLLCNTTALKNKSVCMGHFLQCDF